MRLTLFLCGLFLGLLLGLGSNFFLGSFLRSHSFSLRVEVDGAEYIQEFAEFQQPE